MARLSLVALCLALLSPLSLAQLPAATLPATGLPATTLPATTVPATTLPATTVPATTLPATTVPATTLPATGVPAATLPAKGVPATALPANAGAKKVLTKKTQGKPLVQVVCKTVNENFPFRTTSCVVYSKAKVPICPRFFCTPPPGGECNSGPGAGGISNEICSWSITPNCTVPTPIYPSRGNEYGFGWKTSQDQGPVVVRLLGYTTTDTQTNICPGGEVMPVHH